MANGMRVFKSSLKLPANSEASLAMTLPCVLQLLAVFGNLASK